MIIIDNNGDHFEITEQEHQILMDMLEWQIVVTTATKYLKCNEHKKDKIDQTIKAIKSLRIKFQ